MKLNVQKSKYMAIHFADNYQFSTQLSIDKTQLEEVTETRLIGVIIRNDLRRKSNTNFIVKKAYKRMILL